MRTPTSAALAAAAAALLAVAGCVPGEQAGPLLATEDPDRTLEERPGGAVVQPDARAEIGPYRSVLDVSAQTTGTGGTVTVDRAGLGEDQGWVVILRNDDGATGRHIGHARVQEGAPMESITVDLEEPLSTGDHTLWARLHLDSSPVGQYQWPGRDKPATNADGDIVRAQFTVSVE